MGDWADEIADTLRVGLPVFDDDQELWSPPEGMSARAWVESVEDKVDYVLEPLVAAGNRVVIGGATGAGKTSFVFGLVAAIVGTRSFLGCEAVSQPVLIIDLEQGRRTLRRRLMESGLSFADDLIVYRAPDGLDLNSRVQLDWLVETIEKGVAGRRFRAVVLDPLYKAHAGDSADERAMVDLMRRLDRLREDHGFALIIPMHLRKLAQQQREPTISDIFGSAALCFGAEVVLGLQRLGEESRFDARLFFWKDRDGDIQDWNEGADSWNLMFDRQQGFRRATEDMNRLTSEQKILAYVADSTMPVSRADMSFAVGLTEDTVGAKVKMLVARGDLEMVGKGGRGEHLYQIPSNRIVRKIDGVVAIDPVDAEDDHDV